MEKMKRIFILLLVITGLYIVFNQSNVLDVFVGGRNNNDEAAITNNTEVIKVDVGSVSTTIIPEDRMNLRAEYEGKQRLTVKENGDEVEVSLKGKWFNWFNWGSQKSELKIYIPEDYDQDMLIDLGSGKLDFSGPSKNTPMKLEKLAVDIGSGHMNLRNLEVKEFYQDVSSGNATIDSIKTEKGTFDVSSGNLDIDHFSGEITADVSSGRLAIQVDQLSDSITMDISSGLIDLDLPEDADFTLNGEVNSGKISCDLPLKDKVQNKDKIHGVLGSGKHAINLDVSSGIININ
jgi:lia operon protein LiaG